MANQKQEELFVELFGEGEGPPNPSSSSEASTIVEECLPAPLNLQAAPPELVRAALPAIRELEIARRLRMEVKKTTEDLVLSTLARLESGETAPLRSLKREMKKPASQRGLVPPIVEDEPVDATVLELLLTRLARDGFIVSPTYATTFLRATSSKLVPALVAIKEDINKRGRALYNSGRVSIAQQNEEKIGDPMFPTHDSLLSYLETEEKNLEEMAVCGWDSFLGRSLKLNGRYKNQQQRDEGLEFYMQEHKFREARAKEFEYVVKQGVTALELEALMRKWEATYREAEVVLPEMTEVQKNALLARKNVFEHRHHPDQRPDPRYRQPTVEDAVDDSEVPAAKHKGVVQATENTDIITEVPKIDELPTEQPRQDFEVPKSDELLNEPPRQIPHPNDPWGNVDITIQLGARPPSPSYDSAMLESRSAALLRIPQILAEKTKQTEHLSKSKIPGNVVNLLESNDTNTEDEVISSLKSVVAKELKENAELKNLNSTLKKEQVDRDAKRYEDKLSQRIDSIFNVPAPAPPKRTHAGKDFESLLAAIQPLIADPKPVMNLQVQRYIQQILKRLIVLLKNALRDQEHINELREHLNGKQIFVPFLDIFSNDNMASLKILFTHRMIEDLEAIWDLAKMVDKEISDMHASLQTKNDSGSDEKEEEHLYKSAILRLLHHIENISEEHRTKIMEAVPRDDAINELLNNEAVLFLVEEAAGCVKGKGKAADEHDGKSVLSVMNVHHYARRLLEVPLAQKLLSTQIQEEVQSECFSYYQQNGHKAEQYLADDEGNAQQTVQKATKESQETGNTRKTKKPLSVAEGLRKKMAKAKVEKRLSEVGTAEDTSGEIDLRGGVTNWEEEQRLMIAQQMAAAQSPTLTAQRTTEDASSNTIEEDPTVAAQPTSPPRLLNNMYEDPVMARAVDWYFNRKKYRGKLPGHTNCKCSPAKHAEIRKLMIEMVELRTDLETVGQQKALVQKSLAAGPSSQPILPQKSKATKKAASSKFKPQPDYDTTPSQFQDQTSEDEGGFIDMETLRLHDHLLGIHMQIANGSIGGGGGTEEDRQHIIDMTGMVYDWSIVALAICGDSAALAVAFIQEAEEPIKKYLVKKGEPTAQRVVDVEGLRYAMRYIDYRVNQTQIEAGKTPKFKHGYGFNTTNGTSSKTVQTTLAPSVAGSSGTTSKKSVEKKSGGGPAGVVPPVASTNTASGSSSSSTPAVVSGSAVASRINIPSASSSATTESPAPTPSVRLQELADNIQTGIGSTCDHASALKIAEIFQSGVAAAANIPGMTPEILKSIEATFLRFDVDSTATQATESDTAGASSNAGPATGSDTTATTSSDSNKNKKKRQATKKGGRRR